MLINIDKLKQDIINYYGTATHNGFPAAMMDVIDVENASLEKLVEMARRAGLNLKDYQEDDLER